MRKQAASHAADRAHGSRQARGFLKILAQVLDTNSRGVYKDPMPRSELGSGRHKTGLGRALWLAANVLDGEPWERDQVATLREL